jgi:hypothetical protein
MTSRYFVYKQALLEKAERLVMAHVLREKEDIFYLTLQKLHDVVRTNPVDDQLIRQRKDAFTSYQALTPPRPSRRMARSSPARTDAKTVVRRVGRLAGFRRAGSRSDELASTPVRLSGPRSWRPMHARCLSQRLGSALLRLEAGCQFPRA